jgi:hypothetical protein
VLRASLVAAKTRENRLREEHDALAAQHSTLSTHYDALFSRVAALEARSIASPDLICGFLRDEVSLLQSAPDAEFVEKNSVIAPLIQLLSQLEACVLALRSSQTAYALPSGTTRTPNAVQARSCAFNHHCCVLTHQTDEQTRKRRCVYAQTRGAQ